MKGQWGKLAGYFLGTLIVSTIATVGLPMIGGPGWLPDLISKEGESIDVLFWGLVALSLVIFSIVAALVIYSMLHFRAEPGDMSDGAHIHGNAKLEMVWVIVPSIIVFVVGLLSYMVLQDNEVGLFDKKARNDKGAAQRVVDVHAFSFGWGFRYKDLSGKVQGGTDEDPAGQLVLPVNETVRFNVLSCSGKEALDRVRRQKIRELQSDGKSEFAEIKAGWCEKEWDATTSEDRTAAEQDAEKWYDINRKRNHGEKLSASERDWWSQQPVFGGDDQYIDVNHAFWVPEARLKVDAVAGLRTYVQWTPDKITQPEDTYQVVCAELCGTGHNAMRTDMCVTSRATFDWWMGLDADKRAGATCQVVRLMNCDGMPSDRDSAFDKLATLVKDHPDAGCAKAKEAAA